MAKSSVLVSAIAVAVLQCARPTAAAPHIGIRQDEGSAAVTYESVWSDSKFDTYMYHVSSESMHRFHAMTFGQVAQGEPYKTVAFADTNSLTLEPTSLPESADNIDTCEIYPSCCAPESKSCQAWFSFFDFCQESCLSDPKCTAVEVRMAEGTCALYDYSPDCVINSESKTSDNSIVFAWDNALGYGVPIPEGYTQATAFPEAELKPLETFPLTAEPCSADFASIKDQNVAECTAKCDTDAKCSAFAYKADPETWDYSCTLYGNLEGGWTGGWTTTAFYIKNETIQCNVAKGEYFSYEWYDETAASKGCQRYLQKGDTCDEEYLLITDLTNDNKGCAPGLACVEEDRETDATKCRVPGTFLEEAKAQVNRDWTLIGKALPNTADGINTTDMLFFDFSGRNWAYVKDANRACSDLCGAADLTRPCSAYEIDAEAQRCIIGYGAICASSLVANENAATTLTLVDSKLYSLSNTGSGFDSQARTEIAGFQKLDSYVPVIPSEASANVKTVDIPCDDFYSGDLLAITTDCIDQCSAWDGCHTVLLVAPENKCVLFAGDEGKLLSTASREDMVTFIDPTKLGCTEGEFYGVLEENIKKYSSVKYTNDAWSAEWEAVTAERGFADGGNADSVVIEENWEAKNDTVLATCIAYLKENDICGLEGDISRRFANLLPYYMRKDSNDSDYYGCALGTQCLGTSTTTDCTADDGSCTFEVTEAGRCKVPETGELF